MQRTISINPLFDIWSGSEKARKVEVFLGPPRVYKFKLQFCQRIKRQLPEVPRGEVARLGYRRLVAQLVLRLLLDRRWEPIGNLLLVHLQQISMYDNQCMIKKQIA